MDKKDLIIYGSLAGLTGLAVGYYIKSRQTIVETSTIYSTITNTITVYPKNYLYLVYNIPQYYVVETNLKGQESYYLISEGPGTIAVEIPPGTYSISVSLYNPSTQSLIYQLQNLSITPNPATPGSTVYISAQANTQMTIYLALNYRNYGFHNPGNSGLAITIYYSYNGYDTLGNLVYQSSTQSIILNLPSNFYSPTYFYSYIGTVIIPAGIYSVAFNVNYSTTSTLINAYGYPFWTGSVLMFHVQTGSPESNGWILNTGSSFIANTSTANLVIEIFL